MYFNKKEQILFKLNFWSFLPKINILLFLPMILFICLQIVRNREWFHFKDLRSSWVTCVCVITTNCLLQRHGKTLGERQYGCRCWRRPCTAGEGRSKGKPTVLLVCKVLPQRRAKNKTNTVRDGVGDVSGQVSDSQSLSVAGQWPTQVCLSP